VEYLPERSAVDEARKTFRNYTSGYERLEVYEIVVHVVRNYGVSEPVDYSDRPIGIVDLDDLPLDEVLQTFVLVGKYPNVLDRPREDVDRPFPFWLRIADLPDFVYHDV